MKKVFLLAWLWHGFQINPHKAWFYMRHVSPITHKLSALFKCTNLGYQPRIHRIRSTFDNHVSFCRLFCNFLIAFWLLCMFLLSLPVICFRANILVCHKLITFDRPLTFSGAASVDKIVDKALCVHKVSCFLVYDFTSQLCFCLWTCFHFECLSKCADHRTHPCMFPLNHYSILFTSGMCDARKCLLDQMTN